MLSMLSRKLRRDLWQIKGQMLAIMLVMAAGITSFIISFAVIDSLKLTRDTYYDRYNFADVFVSLKRAPRSVQLQLENIQGVVAIDARVIFGMTLQMPTLNEPGTGLVISIPDHGEPLLNKLYLRQGRYPDPISTEEVLIDEAFANAHELIIGDSVSVILNGVQRQLKVVGVALSPEFVYSIAPGALMPDPLRFGIFWMRERALEATVGMKGAFNDVLLGIEPEADVDYIKSELDTILAKYGGRQSYARDEQLSNFFVTNEITQLENMGLVAPIIFLAVSAFLINVVMSRLISTQREQIGMLKAIGYSDWQVGRHYFKMVSVVTVGGAITGVALGVWMGSGLTRLYAEFFHFPILNYRFTATVAITSVALCFAAVYSGVVLAIRQAVNLPPSEAMRPEAPKSYEASFLTKYNWLKHLSYLSRIILRQIERAPRRAILSVMGLSLSVAILIFSFFIEDSIDRLLDIQYNRIQLEDVNISFVEPISSAAVDSLNAMQGILVTEPVRDVAVTYRLNQAEKKSSLTALTDQPYLRKILNRSLESERIPKQGLLMSETLAKILGAKVGDTIEVQVLEEKQPTLQLQIVRITKQWIGMGAYIHTDYLHNLLDQQPRMTSAALLIDANYETDIYNRLKSVPMIIGLNITTVLMQIFTDIMAENMLMMMTTYIIFASIISFGVIYNTARIALSERWRELASLRVLGLSRREVAYLLFGELSLMTLLSIPVGIAIGVLLSYGMAESMESELFRIPFYIESSTYGYSILVLLVSTLVSFYLVWKQVDSIDLVSAQKGVE